MKRLLLIYVAVACHCSGIAQTTATDFNRPDCNGNNHHLFASLDSNHVAFLEFFMLSCSPCVTAGQHLEALRADLNAEFPGMISAYSIGFSDSYLCTDITNWVSTNSFTTVPMDSGAYQVAYYGGFGMPTIAVVAGTGHQVLFSNVGFSPSDTATMGAAIRNFYSPAGIRNQEPASLDLTVFPQPASGGTCSVSANIPKRSAIHAELYSLDGKLLQSFFSGTALPGKQQWELNFHEIPSGMYFLRFTVDDSSFYKKISLVD